MNSLFIKQLLLLLLLFTACAKQGMPPGGSADKTPPQIIRTIPPANATFVDPNIRVEIRFNEWLNARTVEEAVFISPYLGKEVKIKIGGKKVKIIFPGPLKKDRTYVITLGTGIKDLHNNALEKSFTLAFSTGGILDKGEMKGKVYEKGDAKGIDIWAYVLKDEKEINPSLVEPDYIVQCEEEGDFHFTHIATGRYRLFAVKDRIADRRYTKGEDRVGVTYTDVEIPSQEPQFVDSLFFRMFFQDTLPPSLVRAVSVNEHLLRLLFDQPVFLDAELPKEYVTVNPVEDSLVVLDIKEIFLDPNDNKCIQVGTEPQAEETYRVTVKGVRDEFGNPVDPTYNSVEFKATPQPDTVKPQLTKLNPSPGQKNVYMYQDIHLIFNESIDTGQFNKGFALIDTVNGPVSGTFHWINPAEVSFIPSPILKSLTVYKVSLSGKGIKDAAGNSMDDTLYYFTTLNKDTLSGISGKIFDPLTWEKCDMYITINQIDNEVISYQQKTDSTGIFDFKQIMPGNYIISCFCDRDYNGRYSYGVPYPFTAAERFVVYKDTVLAKSRWPNAENDLTLPSLPESEKAPMHP